MKKGDKVRCKNPGGSGEFDGWLFCIYPDLGIVDVVYSADQLDSDEATPITFQEVDVELIK